MDERFSLPTLQEISTGVEEPVRAGEVRISLGDSHVHESECGGAVLMAQKPATRHSLTLGEQRCNRASLCVIQSINIEAVIICQHAT